MMLSSMFSRSNSTTSTAWPFDQNENCLYIDNYTTAATATAAHEAASESIFFHLPDHHENTFQLQFDQLDPDPPRVSLAGHSDHHGRSTGGGGAHLTTKKLIHNASERERRKKINSIYSTLRSLIPSTDQTRRLSNPATISRAIRYIPELEQQVEGLMKKKEEILLNMDDQIRDLINDNDHDHQEEGSHDKIDSSKYTQRSALPAVTCNRLSEKEVVIQISTNSQANPFSKALLVLEEDGLLPLDASSFESPYGTVFFSLHLQVESNSRLEPEILREKLLNVFLYEKNEALLPKNVG